MISNEAEPWVQPPDEEGLLRSRAIFGNIARVINPATGTFDLGGSGTLVEAIIGIITRHPMRGSELIETLIQWTPGDVVEILNKLGKSGKAQIVKRYGGRFWSALPAYYPTSNQDGIVKDEHCENTQK